MPGAGTVKSDRSSNSCDIPAAPPNAAAPGSQLLPVDVSVLAALVDGNEQLIEEVLGEFSNAAISLGRDIVGCCAALRTTRAAEVAHQLKSSARAVGALQLSEICGVIESAGRSGDIAACSRLAPPFEAELTRVIAFLRGRGRPVL
jgi:two-component system, sensor histidine kinase and response regulator